MELLHIEEDKRILHIDLVGKRLVEVTYLDYITSNVITKKYVSNQRNLSMDLNRNRKL